MKVRSKIILIVLPLIVSTLSIAGFSSSFAAQNAITRIAVDFLGFKAKELKKYADNQWDLLVSNRLIDRPQYLEISKKAIASYASTLVRSDTERIIAIHPDLGIVFDTSNEPLSSEDISTLRESLTSKKEGWTIMSLSNEDRVGQAFFFAPFNWWVYISEARNVFYQEVSNILKQTLIIMGIAACIAIIMLMIFVQIIINPLGKVVKSMKEIITHNDLNQRVPVQFNDEVGELAGTFNVMIQELDKAYSQIKNFAFQSVLAEKREKKIRNIFQKYVPKDVIDKVFINPEAMLVGDKRRLAIFFSDIRSFTTISEGLTPEELVQTLNRYFSIMVDIIVSEGGIVDKYIGDAIMAFYGAPIKGDNDALSAVNAALGMIDAIQIFNEKQREQNQPEFNTGIGINYGLVTVGNIGSDKKMDYTVIGDEVNLASRLEGLTKKYGQKLIFSEAVYRRVKSEYPCRLVDKVVVKGKTTGENIYTAKRVLTAEEEKIWNHHHAGLSFYYAKDFKNALKYFDRILIFDPDDVIAKIYKERSKIYIATPPDEGWVGLEVLKEK
ncbi:adenylate/guanylate cyclase domain-containing protein [Spirochaeta cellobiosiphila]|uniref:adenylate/guanylate cyclase domain-containing protein n=1 Tax=Spirochaeta cellobiosiphila TaxID=504483 RepID=UPI0003F853C6|nr:adenylate/guanylate cyclase domain-containing protein [Spirochaeta cellobiosiphila]